MYYCIAELRNVNLAMCTFRSTLYTLLAFSLYGQSLSAKVLRLYIIATINWPMLQHIQVLLNEPLHGDHRLLSLHSVGLQYFLLSSGFRNQEAIWEARPKWYNIGIRLKLYIGF